MLTAEDTPTIRNAILKRLEKEPGARVCEITFQTYDAGDTYYADPPACKLEAVADMPFLRIAILSALGQSIIHDARFDIPIPFEIGHLHNEIDEIAESYKIARRDFFTADRIVSERQVVKGTGLRGRWQQASDV